MGEVFGCQTGREVAGDDFGRDSGAQLLALGAIAWLLGELGLTDLLAGLVPTGTGLGSLLLIALGAAVLSNLINNLPATLLLLPAVAPAGEGPLLAVEQAVVFETDPARAREVAKAHTGIYTGLPNYANNLRRLDPTLTDEDFAGLQQMLDEQQRQLARNPSATWEPLAFELAVVEISGNSWLHEVELMLRDAWLALSSGLRASVGRHGEWLAEHHAIVASMRSRNAAQAQRLVTAHLSLERFEDDLTSLRAAAAPGPSQHRPGKRPGDVTTTEG